MYILKSSSSSDGKSFECSSKVIESSTLLRNIRDLTHITNEIEVDCLSEALEEYIHFINYSSDHEDSYFNEYTEEKLATFIKDTCILDSDVLLDALADEVLRRLEDANYQRLQGYLGIADDYSESEREWMDNHELEFMISLNEPSSPFNFPLKFTNFYSLNSKFSSPMNIFLSRLCQRSGAYTAYQLSLTCKALKAEIDRHPIKISRFIMYSQRGILIIEKKLPSLKIITYFNASINTKEAFDGLLRRKLIVNDDYIGVSYGQTPLEEISSYLSLDFIIPFKKTPERMEILIGRNNYYIDHFDAKKCPFPSLYFIGFKRYTDFSYVYHQLIAPDISKEIEIYSREFNFFTSDAGVRIYKRPNASKFHQCLICRQETPLPKFKHFLENFMEAEGHLQFYIPGPFIPHEIIYPYNDGTDLKYILVKDILNYM